MKSDAIILNLNIPTISYYWLQVPVPSHTRIIAKKVPMHFYRLYSNIPNLTHNDESFIRRAMVLAKLLLATVCTSL